MFGVGVLQAFVVQRKMLVVGLDSVQDIEPNGKSAAVVSLLWLLDAGAFRYLHDNNIVKNVSANRSVSLT